jgi:hypothetical protein
VGKNALGLDPKDFKVGFSDKNKTVLHHKKGHVLTIAHNAVSPKVREQLSALSKVASEDRTHNQAEEAQDQGQYGKTIQKAEGGEVEHKHKHVDIKEALSPVKKFVEKHTDNPNLNPETPPQPYDIPGPSNGAYAEGGEAEGKGVLQQIQEYLSPTAKITNDIDKQREAAQSGDLPPAMPHKIFRKPQEYAEGTPDAPISEEPQDEPGVAFGQQLRQLISDNPHVKAADALLRTEGKALQSIPGFVKGLMGNKSPNKSEAPAQQPQQQMSQPAPQPEQPQTPQVPQPDPMDQAIAQGQGMLEQGYQNQLQGLQQEAAVKGQIGEQQAQQIEQNLNAQNTAKAAYQQSFNQMEQERQAIAQDMAENHIDPEKYWTGDAQGNGGHSKIMAGLGMILAGFNPTSNPNAAINFLKFQMEQNLKGQEMEMGKKNNLLTNNLHQFGNLKDAADMTRLQQADILHNQMLMAASQAATPAAKAEMLQKAGALQQQFAPLRQQFVMRQAMMKLANSTDGNTASNTAPYEHMLQYMRLMNPEQAKEMEGRLIPGVGVAKIPLPKEARDQIINHTKLEQALQDLNQFTHTHTTLVPGSRDYNVGAQKAMIVQTMLREGLLNTVYREGEQPLLDKLIKSNPANFLKEFNTLPQIKELMRNNQAQANTLKSNYGIPIKQAPPEQQYKTVNGVKYMRGPKGEAIPVK